MTTQIEDNSFAANLATRNLSNLADELAHLRDRPALRLRDDGTYEGEILSFVKGLRLSAKVIYFLRKTLEGYGLEVNWGHILSPTGQSCSAECDIIIHHPSGLIDRWNEGNKPIMDFVFVESDSVVAVVSCKSEVTSIDSEYCEKMSRFNVGKLFLFGEFCSKTNYNNLRTIAREVGYEDFWVAYFPNPQDADSFEVPGLQHFDFWKKMRELVQEAISRT